VSTGAIIGIAVAGALVLLALGGALANARHRRRTVGEFQLSVEHVNRALAAAHAQDKGWEPEQLAAAARRAFEAERPGVTVLEQALVAVVDRPGVEEDQAVFRFTTEAGETRATMDRDAAGAWRLAGLA
jgi:hypothetical protein